VSSFIEYLTPTRNAIFDMEVHLGVGWTKFWSYYSPTTKHTVSTDEKGTVNVIRVSAVAALLF
jgi:hypothetical protein